MPVSETENASTSPARLRSSFSGLQPPLTGSTVSVTWPMGELEGVREQVLDDLLQALRVGEHRLRQPRIHADQEVERLGLRHVAEGALHVVLQLVERQFADIHHHRARLDLRQVENVVDQHQQIVAGRVYGLGELDLLGAGCRPGSRTAGRKGSAGC